MEVGMIDISDLHRAEKILVRLLVHIHTITWGVKNNGFYGLFFNQFCNILVILPFPHKTYYSNLNSVLFKKLWTIAVVKGQTMDF